MVEEPNAATSPLEAENENDSDLLDRLRSTALGNGRDAKSRRSAQLAFDPEVDLEKRMRHIAGLTDVDSPKPTEKSPKKRALSWLPIPLGILAVMSLGAAMVRNSTSERPTVSAAKRKAAISQTLSTSAAKARPASSAQAPSKRTDTPPDKEHLAGSPPSPP